MGCDIHIVVERRKKPAGRWIGLYSTDVYPIRKALQVARRDYGFFAEVAGVRGSPSNVRNYPRNLPEDVSPLAWQQYMRCPTDHHSASHMTPAEFIAAYRKANPLDPFRDEFGASDLLGIDDDGGQPFEFRVVFWFDN